MNLIIVLLAVQLACGFEGEVFRRQAKHITGSSSTRRVQTRTVTQTITVSTCVSDPAEGGPRIPTWKWKCGKILYDPGKYVCRRGSVLCPIINGELLSICNQTCFSTFTSQCHNDTHIHPLPSLPTRFVLRAFNPFHPRLHNTLITVCNHTLRIGNRTCSSCPSTIPSCPLGNITVFDAANLSSMAVTVPGGQSVFLRRDGSVGVGRAHSGWMSPGAHRGGWTAFEGGGWVSQWAERWEACGRGPPWRLKGRNGTRDWDADEPRVGDGNGLGMVCTGVNLRVERAEGVGAWEYT